MTALLHCQTFVGGEFRSGNGRFERRNPSTGDVVAVADLADEATVGAAVSAAATAFEG
jgi:acyl-CoA reductase-like NAD-dependent aldehyde dehydrogenase